ncbi:MAG: hypothetical protein V7L21_12585 [Nostoc sp.]|uniref:hypothetical protein n=1 Tax=unclassified Nostoc TaxID=2593658 RepID=UPI0025E87EED|nr:hypothetical protein [Nostoc sp. NMS9]MBN3939082.1 hypothetical protein [Nostoc sp. NMS9]
MKTLHPNEGLIASGQRNYFTQFLEHHWEECAIAAGPKQERGGGNCDRGWTSPGGD